MMIKQVLTVFCALLAAGNVFAADGVYVRKQQKPKFFIPDEALSQPEKLPVIQHKKEIQPEEKPLYQQKFDDYGKDLEQISRVGYIPENKNLRDDLAQMTSDERIVVKKKPHQTRHQQGNFDKALKDLLESD